MSWVTKRQRWRLRFYAECRSPGSERAAEAEDLLDCHNEDDRSFVSIRTISSREVYRNPWTSVREDVIERSNGQRGIYGVIDKGDASIILALERTGEGEFLYLVEQFRYTVQARCLEFPQGSWEGEETSPEELARGELREETGLSAGRMTHLRTLQVGYGVLNQKQHVFLAEELKAGEGIPDQEEHDLVLHRVSVVEFEQMLLDGRVVDECSAAAWGIYLVWRRSMSGDAGAL